MKKLLLCASAFALMFGSCSKDDTEVVSVVGNKDVVFTAGMTIGNDTRTGVEVDTENRKLIYTWDFGDMVGAAVKGASEVVPFINVAGVNENGEKVPAKTADFVYAEEDLNYLGGDNPEVYFAYPYEKDNTVDANGNIEMTIPATQRYRAGSFAQMTAPAVAYVPAFEKGTHYSFKSVSSFIRVPLLGHGTVSKIKMQVKTGSVDKTAVKLAGSAKVDIDSDTPKLTVPTKGADAWADAITLDFGKAGLDLSYTEKKYIVYVIPAELKLTKDETVFEFEATFDDGVTTETQSFTVPATMTVPVNYMQGLGTIYFGVEDKILISNAADFVKYVYQVNNNTTDKTAILTSSIDFRKFNVQEALDGCEDATMIAALTEYQTNGLAINSIGDVENRKGAKIDGNGCTVSNLQVKGNGIFAIAATSLKNIIFSNVTVTVPNGQKTPALFAGMLPGSTAVSNVKFTGGYLKNVAEGVVPAMISSASATTLPTAEQIAITSYPRVNETSNNAYYAATLTVNGNVEDKNIIKSYFGTTPRFAVIKGSKVGAAIKGVSADAAKIIINAVNPATKQTAFSVIDAKGTSYWTGLVATSADAEIDSAEELAYVVMYGGTAAMKANIDLCEKPWAVDSDAVVSIDGAGHIISNAVVAGNDAEATFVTYSLLGNKVKVSDLTVDGVTIDVEAGEKPCVIGGVAYQGSATDVVVKNMTINIADDVKFLESYNHVGGLVSNVSDAAACTGNTVESVGITTNGNKNIGPVGGMFGQIAGSKFAGNTISADAAMVGSWTITADSDVSSCVAAGTIFDVITVSATQAGQTLTLGFDECAAAEGKYWNNLVNGSKVYKTTVVIEKKIGEETSVETKVLEPTK